MRAAENCMCILDQSAVHGSEADFNFCAQTGKYVVPGYLKAQSPADSDGVISFLSRAADPGAFCLLACTAD